MQGAGLPADPGARKGRNRFAAVLCTVYRHFANRRYTGADRVYASYESAATRIRGYMSIDEKMKSLGLKLPPPSPSVGAFVSHVRSGNLLFLSGQIAKRDGKSWVGKLGEDLTTSEGKQAARSVAVDLLGTLRAAVGDLNRIRIVKLRVLVNSAPSFTEQQD